MTIYKDQKEATNKYLLGAIIQSDDVLKEIRKEIKKVKDYSIPIEDLRVIIQEDVLKREIIEGDEASDALKEYKSSKAKKLKQSSVLENKQIETAPVGE